MDKFEKIGVVLIICAALSFVGTILYIIIKAATQPKQSFSSYTDDIISTKKDHFM